MDLAKQAQIIGNIHDTLSQYVGQKLRVRANMGRSKIVESEGVLMPGASSAIYHGSKA